ncbi:MAG: tRNA modification GTPase [Paracoccaceae bacterium]|jgi:tRNA modification GTPase
MVGRQPALRKLYWNGSLLDEALLLHFPKGHSFTGEDVIELQLHGSSAIVKATLSALASLPGARHAEAGEFTRRALENNRLDLTQVEGLADLIDAETEAQRVQAARTFQGEFSTQVAQWRTGLLRATALIEATIDFADEDVPVDVSPEVKSLLTNLISSFDTAIKGVAFAERVRDGFEVAIVGAPNTGKSTLLNVLVGREAAITSEIAGTTRDVIEVQMDIAGLPVTILDTAGLRDTDDVVENLGIDRAVARANAADIRVLMDQSDSRIVFRPDDILISPKADTGAKSAGIPVSGKTGQGVEQLLSTIGEVLAARAPAAVSATHQRHEHAIVAARCLLIDVRSALCGNDVFAELLAADMRKAIAYLDELTGRIGVEDLLGEIFSSFCIGK